MGEGRRDRNSNRHRSNLGIEKSSSDTEVARSKIKNRKSKKSKGKWPFLDGITVDELGRYRRRRFQNYPKDTLGAYETSNVKENLITEYRHSFRSTSEDSILKLLDNPSGKLSDEIDSKINQDSRENLATEPHSVVQEFRPSIVTEPQPAAQGFINTDDDTTMETAVERSRYEDIPVSGTRRMLIRRGTSLKREGDEFYGNTESSTYVPYEGQHRAELARRPTSLKLEGSMDTTTEQCEKFIEWLNVSRPDLIRIPSNLKLEGDFETTTENHEKYVPFVGARRPELLRQIAHLQLEGESTFLPEYTDVFREHGVCEKRMPVFPENYFKTGDVNETTLNSNIYGKSKNKDSTMENPDDELSKGTINRDEEKRSNEEEDMRMLVSKLEDLKGPPLEVPEYKDAYKDFPRERPKLMRPEDEIGRADGTKIHSSISHHQFQTKIYQDPEYKSKFLDSDRMIFRKPPLSLRPSGASSGFGGRTSREYQRNEATSEVRSQYISHGQIPRVETLKMPANLRLEGNIDMEPEYKVAYCTRKNNSIGNNEPRIHRHRDRSISASRKRDNTWINNNNGEHFGRINAADEQDAFQVLSTRVHDESIVGKPPPGTKRGSRSSEWQTPSHRPMHLDVNSSPGLRNRSPSPTYRLQVHDVDNESRSFENRKISPSQQIYNRIRSPSPGNLDHHQDISQRSYSPSFGRINLEKNPRDDDQAFLILDTARNDYSPFNRIHKRSRKVIDRNSNVTENMRNRQKNVTPTNWMPPWYDNTNTI